MMREQMQARTREHLRQLAQADAVPQVHGQDVDAEVELVQRALLEPQREAERRQLAHHVAGAQQPPLQQPLHCLREQAPLSMTDGQLHIACNAANKPRFTSALR